ncbi:hypothetical protein [Sphingomicrobium sediminis]|uniref:Uncharacterized protein n=1 Tax=Sphingomicrobium sediminis TaxID=2950949 RepID=A0A9X2EFK2_9SPHN|nr:hypothetical protein [Sphingomicrobium sediminis]MCM8557055.1 hypothetical protein [Sphingomicrobium sediminis]
MTIRFVAALLAASALPATPAQALDEATASIDVIYQGFDARSEAAFDEAIAIWERCLVSDVPITISATAIANGPAGFAYPNSIRNQDYLPVRDAWYPTALAGALAGRDVSADPDMAIYMKLDDRRYYGPLADLPEEKTDFVNVAVHEIAHGLGISSATFIPWQGDPIASIGMPNAYANFFDFPFEIHEQDGTPFVYDTFIRLGDGRSLMDFANPSIDLAFAIANPTVQFDGKNAIAANQGYPVGVSPTNVSHIPQFPRGAQPIMLPDSGTGAPQRNPDRILLGMLEDLGWTISEGCKARAS